MTPERIAFVLTALAAVVVVLTRVRLGGSAEAASGRVHVGKLAVNLHTGFGVLALAASCWYLFVKGSTPLGWAAVALWWLTALAGLLILTRWLPAHGRHASDPESDSWGEGPGLSVLGHVGMVVGAVVITVLVAAGKI